ncbi:MAG: histidinol dehydrogenase, partial [Pseudomonadota bacterium]
MQAQPLFLRTTDPDFESRFQARLHWSADTDAAIEERVAGILADVQQRGDDAVLDYTQRFDRLAATTMAELTLHPDALKAAFEGLPQAQRAALETAADRVRR